jgi:hypothetical protein
MSTSKLCIYTDYMVVFESSVWMDYIEKLNNSEYPSDRKRFKCAKQPLVFFIVGIKCVNTLGPVGSTKSIVKM